MRGLIVTTTLVATLLLPGCEKYALDRQMEELCAKDGGVRVYEKVVLPAEMFDKTGQLITDSREVLENGTVILRHVGDKYVIEHLEEVIHPGNPHSGFISEGRLLKHVTLIKRVSDKKILGAEISYGRTGGDLTLGHPSQNYCPKPRSTPGVVHAVFTKGD